MSNNMKGGRSNSSFSKGCYINGVKTVAPEHLQDNRGKRDHMTKTLNAFSEAFVYEPGIVLKAVSCLESKIKFVFTGNSRKKK